MTSSQREQPETVALLDEFDQYLRTTNQSCVGTTDNDIETLKSELASRSMGLLVPLGQRFSYTQEFLADRFIQDPSELATASIAQNSIAIADPRTRPLNGETVAVLSSGAVGIRPAKVVVFYDSELVNMLCGDDSLVADLAYRAEHSYTTDLHRSSALSFRWGAL